MPTLFANHTIFTTKFFRAAFLGLVLAAATSSEPPLPCANETSFANALTPQIHLAANIEVEPDGHQETTARG